MFHKEPLVWSVRKNNRDMNTGRLDLSFHTIMAIPASEESATEPADGGQIKPN